MASEGFIPVEGGKVWYRIAGETQTGVPLLTLHGGPGYPHDYLEPLEALAAERPVIFYDQLGCGASERPDDRDHNVLRHLVPSVEHRWCLTCGWSGIVRRAPQLPTTQSRVINRAARS